ncbi:MAG: sn-glycerol-1-phosphate dehydrogenase [Christensenellales bacterium]|jgi:glycerol-1-phosphate dehydrogenase [NAD(P)+]
MKFGEMSIHELIDPKGFPCECGRTHKIDLKFLRVGSGVIQTTPEAIQTLGCSYPFVVCDEHTYKAAGEQVVEILKKANIKHKLFILPARKERPKPEEIELGSVAMHFDPKCDLVLGVGSGVINDICKIFGYVSNRPSMIVGTAPSMDGYASNSSSMEVNNVKTTIYTQLPSAIILDVDILKNAPMRMLWAGFGDIMAKFLSICEWKISNIVTGEYFCDNVSDIMRTTARKVIEYAPGIPKRDPEAIQAISEGLVAAGMAMSFAEMSRPASGLEHHFSHMWEMMALERGKPYDLHGIQVGVATLLVCEIYDKLLSFKPDRAKAEKFLKEFNSEEWEANVRRVFGDTAPEIFAIEKKAGKNAPENHARRMNNIIERWDEIHKTMEEELPDYRKLYEAMKIVGMPMTPEELDLSKQDVRDAFICSRDMRDRYLMSSMLWDIGELYDFADEFFPV